MNTFRTELLVENGEYFVKAFGAKLKVDGITGELLKEKQIPAGEVILGVRPEHVNLGAEAAEDAIEGTVLVNEMMGSELHLHIQVEGGSKIVARIPTVDLSHEQRKNLHSGCPLRVSFPGKVMYLFDPETEQNLLY